MEEKNDEEKLERTSILIWYSLGKTRGVLSIV